MQLSLDYADRIHTKRKLHTLYNYIYELMVAEEWAREIKERNRLIRYVWDNHNPYENSESITRIQRKIITDYPFLDTENNIAKRANRETVYHSLNTL